MFFSSLWELAEKGFSLKKELQKYQPSLMGNKFNRNSLNSLLENIKLSFNCCAKNHKPTTLISFRKYSCNNNRKTEQPK